MQTSAALLNPEEIGGLFCWFKKCDKNAFTCVKMRQKLQLCVKLGLTGLISCPETEFTVTLCGVMLCHHSDIIILSHCPPPDSEISVRFMSCSSAQPWGGNPQSYLVLEESENKYYRINVNVIITRGSDFSLRQMIYCATLQRNVQHLRTDYRLHSNLLSNLKNHSWIKTTSSQLQRSEIFLFYMFHSLNESHYFCFRAV